MVAARWSTFARQLYFLCMLIKILIGTTKQSKIQTIIAAKRHLYCQSMIKGCENWWHLIIVIIIIDKDKYTAPLK